MKALLHRFFYVTLLLLVFSGNMNAQTYTITGNVNSTTLSCGTFTGKDIISIGNGTTTPSNLIMDGDLDLSTCSLAPLQIIVNKATIDFTTANKRLYLPEGSSFTFINGGTLNPPGGNGGGCTGNDRIYIGGVLVATCQGSAGILGFDDLISLGGTGRATSNSPICSGNTINLNATPPPSGTYTYSWSGPNGFSSTSQNPSPFLATTTPNTAGLYTVIMTRISDSKSIEVNTTVIVNALPVTPAISAGGPTTFCTGGSVTLTSSAGTSYLWSTGALTQSISPTTSGNYTVQVTNASGCQSASSSATVVTVNPLPVIATQPVNQLDCEGSSVKFKVVASGTGLSYTWQRKKPSDVAFVTIPAGETNTTYPTPNEIQLVNVGSAQYPNGTQFQVVVSNGTCTVVSSIATLSVNEITGINSPALTPSQSVNNVTLCYGSNYSYTATISNPSNGTVSYQWKSQVASGSWNNVVDGLHFSGATTPTLNIIDGTPAESAKYRVDIVYNRTGGTCSVSSFSKVRFLTFLPLLTIPQIIVAQPDCTISTGTITVTVQSASDTYSFDNGLNYQSSNVKSGLAPNSYNVIIKNTAGCISSVTSSAIIAVPAAAIWNGSGWTNGPPTSNQALEFTGNYNSTGDLTACSCTVTNGSVVFNPGHTLKMTNWVRVNGGSLTFENNASLVQINNVSNTNSGTIRYKRQTTKISNMDYTYWSTPVLPFTLGSVSPLTAGDKFYSYDVNVEDWKQESAATPMVPGIGYIIRGPQTYQSPNPPNLYEAPFVGVPNNGHYEITGIIADRSYLLGNPYPSALNADSFLDDNQNVLDGTLYFWTHNTPIAIGTPDPGSGLWAYSGDDYASYNRTGGVTTAPAPSSVAPYTGINGNIPSGKIASGQGFFGSSKETPIGSTIVFDNSMRVGVGGITGNNAQFFRTKEPKVKTAVELEKHRVWLDLTNAQGAFKQTLIGYVTNATNDYEGRFDGETFDGNDFLDFYSINQDKNLTIQGRAVPFDVNDVIPLGYRVAIGGAFTIKIGQTDGIFSDQLVFLEDKLTNAVFNLKSGNYTFSTAAGTFEDRFVLRYTDKTLSIDDMEANDRIIVLYSNNLKKVIIQNYRKDTTINTVNLINMLGQKIANWDVKGKEQSSIQMPIKNVPSDIYIVKIKTTKGEVSKKIVIKD